MTRRVQRSILPSGLRFTHFDLGIHQSFSLKLCFCTGCLISPLLMSHASLSSVPQPRLFRGRPRVQPAASSGSSGDYFSQAQPHILTLARVATSYPRVASSGVRARSPSPCKPAKTVYELAELIWKSLKYCKDLRLRIEALEAAICPSDAAQPVGEVTAEQWGDAAQEVPGVAAEEQASDEMSG